MREASPSLGEASPEALLAVAAGLHSAMLHKPSVKPHQEVPRGRLTLHHKLDVNQ